MYYLLRKKKTNLKSIAVILLLLTASPRLFSQNVELNLPDHDNKKYYLGIALMYVSSGLRVSHHPSFLGQDTIQVIDPKNTAGLGLAGLHTFTLSQHFEVRAVFPQLLFATKSLIYNVKYPDPAQEETAIMTKNVESIVAGAGLHLKFRSDRINNFAFYIFGGGKIDYDASSNSGARRAENLVKLKKFDYGVEGGIGFNFYFPVFILSPELKISNGLSNSHSRDQNLKFSSTIDKLNTRMILFSLIFEG